MVMVIRQPVATKCHNSGSSVQSIQHVCPPNTVIPVTPGLMEPPVDGKLQFDLSLLLHLTPTLSILLTSWQFTQK